MATSSNQFYEKNHDQYFDVNKGNANDILFSSHTKKISTDLEIIDDFINLIQSKNDKIVLLDAGCGPGARVSEYICSKCPNINVTLLDAVQKTTDTLRPKYKNVFNCKLGETLPFENESFDAIVCIYVIQHLDHNDLDSAVKEFERVLKKGGNCMIVFKYGYKKLVTYDIFYDEYREFNLYTHIDIGKSLDLEQNKIIHLIGNEDYYFSDTRPIVNSIFVFEKQ